MSQLVRPEGAAQGQSMAVTRSHVWPFPSLVGDFVGVTTVPGKDWVFALVQAAGFYNDVPVIETYLSQLCANCQATAYGGFCQ